MLGIHSLSYLVKLMPQDDQKVRNQQNKWHPIIQVKYLTTIIIIILYAQQNDYALDCGLKCHTISEESIDPVKRERKGT